MSAKYCRTAPGHAFHGPYHDREYGFPARDDAVLFERLVLEINQAGLSWLTVLKKRAAFQRAFRGFDIDAVAAFGPDDVKRLLADAGIIRNRLKVGSGDRKRQDGSGDPRQPRLLRRLARRPSPALQKRLGQLFKETFRFTGGEIVGEFLMSLGYLPGAHVPSCPVHRRIGRKAPWRIARASARVRRAR